YKIKPVKVDSRGVQYFEEKDFIALKNKQTYLYDYFRENYFTYQEALGKGLGSWAVLQIGYQELPELSRINSFHKSSNVYNKKLVLEAVETIARREKLLNVTQISKLLGVRYQFTNTILEEWGITAKDKGLSKYYDPKDVDYLLQKQAERYKYFTENYYTAKEIESLGVTYYKNHFKEIRGENIDSIAK